MKTLKIAALGVAALGAAALPVAGAFAANYTSFTETVTATVQTACGVYSEYTNATSKTEASDKTYNIGNIALGATGTASGDTYKVVCNDNGGWTVSAVGAQETGHVNEMKPSTTSTYIATGTETSGTAGKWAFKLTGAGSASIASGYNAWIAVPSASTPVVTAGGATDGSTTFKTDYQVYIGTQTPADTYTGKVTYSLTAPNA